MTFLPIIGRELRVAARKRSTFWLRVATAGVGLLVGGACLLLTTMMGSPRVGPALFGTLTWISVIAALSAGLFFTADSLSEEKREGTLGFLFLTDLRGYDVVGGKLLATSLRGGYALLALFPVLGLTLMMGGTTGAQFWKTALALLNALICSLMAGLFVSALSRDAQKAMVGTLLLLLLLIFGGPLTDVTVAAIRRQSYGPVLSLLSPGYVFVNAAWSGKGFWNGLLTTQIVAWCLFAFACLAAPRVWKERGRQIRGTSSLRYLWKYGNVEDRQSLRRRLIDRNPMLWLTCRERFQGFGLWVISLLVSGGFVLLAVSSNFSRVEWIAWQYVGVLYIWVLYLWAASQASRFFIEAKRNGLLELLLSGPLSERKIVRGQLQGLLRLFAIPLLLLIAVHIGGRVMALISMGRFGGPTPGYSAIDLVLIPVAGTAALVSVVGDLAALSWFGMWMGLTSKSPSWATVKTFGLVHILPQMVFWFVSTMGMVALFAPWGGRRSFSFGITSVLWWQILPLLMHSLLTLGKNVGFILVSRNKLYGSFRAVVTGTNRAYSVVVPPPLPVALRPPTTATGF